MLKYPHLLSPMRIGDVVLKNRIATTNASPHFLQGPETFPSENYRAYLAQLAKSASTVTIGAWGEYPQQRVGDIDSDHTHMQAWDYTDPSVLNYISMMCQEVHMQGSKILITMNFPFPKGYTLQGGMPFGGRYDEIPYFPQDRMGEVVEEFVRQVARYKSWGFDGVSMRFDISMSAVPNERQDDYGGDVVRRTRLHRECYAAVKKALGRDFITEAIIAGEQPLGYRGDTGFGYTLEDAITFAKTCDGWLDVLQIREKDMAISHPTGFTYRKNAHMVMEYCRAMKNAGVTVPLQPIGGFQDPEYLEQCLAEGICDMVSIVRGLFADNDYARKLYDGRGEDITPCIKCNRCHGTVRDPRDPWVSVCSVNPRFGKWAMLPRMENAPTGSYKVAVIGGGPAGMYAAISAAERGNEVTLFEKTGWLGGQLWHANFFSFKWPIKDYRDWLVQQLVKKGVKVVMNTEATPEMIKTAGFDVVIAATGAAAQLPAGIEGLRDADGKALYPTCLEAAGHEKEMGKHVVIVGGSEVGVETALYLLENGHDVTILTRQGEIGHDISKLHYMTWTWVRPASQDKPGGMRPEWEKYDNLTGLVNVTTKSVKDNVVTYVDAEGAEHMLAADNVIICGGSKARVGEAMAFYGAAERTYMVGDCAGAGCLSSCVEQVFGAINQF